MAANSGQPGVCRSCGAQIVWMRTEHGRAMPCDPEEVEVVKAIADWTSSRAGKQERLRSYAVIVRADGSTVAGLRTNSPAARILLDAFPDAKRHLGRTSHFATCPNATDHRRPR